jgi:hypothetical protein
LPPGAAGLSLATGATAAVGSVNPDLATSALVAEQVMDEEQIQFTAALKGIQTGLGRLNDMH